jgi:hypothetical protein
MPTGSQQLPDLNTLVADLLAGRLTEAQAAAIAALGPEAVTSLGTMIFADSKSFGRARPRGQWPRPYRDECTSASSAN